MKSLNVLFLWHMHQPLYRPDSQSFHMPWVRLHGTKDYTGMAELVSESSAFRMTFNFTPVLWDQLEAYANGDSDRELDIAVKPSASLTLAERRFILSKMFTGNPVSLINPHPRYADLYDRYGRGGEEAAHRMSDQDITDLVVWRILAWIYPDTRNGNTFISGLMQKGERFTEEEKLSLIRETHVILSNVLPKYLFLENIGQISMATSPYYHPILPLILDTEIARECSGISSELPRRFRSPDDADWHVRRAKEKHFERFGSYPAGMWPSEGSVSQEAAAVFASNGIRWIATDEIILKRSRHSLQPNAHIPNREPNVYHIYNPYFLDTEKGSVAVFFRDHVLSDLIGFDYQSLIADEAVNNFILRLTRIRDKTQNLPFDPCAAIILDGENAWEHYADGGFPFLRKLFERICLEPGLHLETMEGYLNRTDPSVIPHLGKIEPGSWINGDFSIWIGQSEENKAWNLLVDFSETLQAHEEKTGKTCDEARHFLRKAQGSDSFWWFGDVHYTSEKQDFDKLFRDLLVNGYESAGLIPPQKLFSPLSSTPATLSSVVRNPICLVSPRIDGEITSYYDWFGAGSVSFRGHFSAMHAVAETTLFSKLYFGYDLDAMYIRLDPDKGFLESSGNDFRLDIIFSELSVKSDLSVHVEKNRKGTPHMISISNIDGSIRPDSVESVFGRIFEIKIPFKLLKLRKDEKVAFHVEIWVGDRMSGRIPDVSDIELSRPSEDYDSILWRV